MDVLMYLRKSRAEELHDSVEDTLRRHREQLEELARIRGYNIIQTFEEVRSGESLYSRPQALAMLEAVSTGNFEAVLVVDIDRLGRSSMMEQGIIFDTFSKTGTKIITLDKVYDLSDDTDEESTEFKSFIARRELKLIKKRFRRGIEKSLDEGFYLANAPYGYRKTTVNRRSSLEIYEPEAAFVRMIFELYTSGALGTHLIAERLNALGAHPARSDRFSRNSVTYILKNPVYIGKVVWNKNHYVTEGGVRHSVPTPEKKRVLDGIHPPIIDEETFEKAQMMLKKQWHKKYYDGTVANPLAGLVRCGNCGGLMMRHPAGKKTKVPFILCQKAGCIPTSRAEDVEEAVLASIKEQLRALDASIEKDSAPDVSAFEKNIFAAEAEIGKLDSQLRKIHDLLEQGIYDVSTFLSRRDEINARVNYLKNYIDDEKLRRQAVLDADRRKLSSRIHSVLDVYAASDAAGRNALLRSIVDHVVYYKTERGASAPFSVLVKLSGL